MAPPALLIILTICRKTSLTPPLPPPQPQTMTLTCASKHLCGMLTTPINHAVHHCLNCCKPVHSIFCALWFCNRDGHPSSAITVKDLIPQGFTKLDNSQALLCLLCVEHILNTPSFSRALMSPTNNVSAGCGAHCGACCAGAPPPHAPPTKVAALPCTPSSNAVAPPHSPFMNMAAPPCTPPYGPPCTPTTITTTATAPCTLYYSHLDSSQAPFWIQVQLR